MSDSRMQILEANLISNMVATKDQLNDLDKHVNKYKRSARVFDSIYNKITKSIKCSIQNKKDLDELIELYRNSSGRSSSSGGSISSSSVSSSSSGSISSSSSGRSSSSISSSSGGSGGIVSIGSSSSSGGSSSSSSGGSISFSSRGSISSSSGGSSSSSGSGSSSSSSGGSGGSSSSGGGSLAPLIAMKKEGDSPVLISPVFEGREDQLQQIKDSIGMTPPGVPWNIQKGNDFYAIGGKISSRKAVKLSEDDLISIYNVFANFIGKVVKTIFLDVSGSMCRAGHALLYASMLFAKEQNINHAIIITHSTNDNICSNNKIYLLDISDLNREEILSIINKIKLTDSGTDAKWMAKSMQLLVKIINALDVQSIHMSITDGDLKLPSEYTAKSDTENYYSIEVNNKVERFNHCLRLIYLNIVHKFEKGVYKRGDVVPNTLSIEFPTKHFDRKWTDYQLESSDTKGSVTVLTITGNQLANRDSNDVGTELFENCCMDIKEPNGDTTTISLNSLLRSSATSNITHTAGESLEAVSTKTVMEASKRAVYEKKITENVKSLLEYLETHPVDNIINNSKISDDIAILNSVSRTTATSYLNGKGQGFADRCCTTIIEALFNNFIPNASLHYKIDEDGNHIRTQVVVETSILNWRDIGSDTVVSALTNILRYIIELYKNKKFDEIHLINELIVSLFTHESLDSRSFMEYIANGRTIGTRQYHGICLLIYAISYILRDAPEQLLEVLTSTGIFDSISTIVNGHNTAANKYFQIIILIGLVLKLKVLQSPVKQTTEEAKAEEAKAEEAKAEEAKAEVLGKTGKKKPPKKVLTLEEQIAELEVNIDSAKLMIFKQLCNDINLRLDFILKAKSTTDFDNIMLTKFEDMQLIKSIFNVFNVDHINVDGVIALMILVHASDEELALLSIDSNAIVRQYIERMCTKDKCARIKDIADDQMFDQIDTETSVAIISQGLHIFKSSYQTFMLTGPLYNQLAQILDINRSLSVLLIGGSDIANTDIIQQHMQPVIEVITSRASTVEQVVYTIKRIAKNTHIVEGIRKPFSLLQLICLIASNLYTFEETVYTHLITKELLTQIFGDIIMAAISEERAAISEERAAISEERAAISEAKA